MNLQTLINERDKLNANQFDSLKTLLIYRINSTNSRKIVSILRNKFYTSLDKTEFAKLVQILPDQVLLPYELKNRTQVLALIRKLFIAIFDEDNTKHIYP